eukprot:TRINITY_DN7811_c0_g2_i1.p1 TRINITY_DN7811_c0_g2~~TRINITY_DN7811_c0_g2_i1.p1  ORF type:complete len:1063 (-),score=224.84 TRINITY_DN7811_c0_g2_i1:303-3491(-)
MADDDDHDKSLSSLGESAGGNAPGAGRGPPVAGHAGAADDEESYSMHDDDGSLGSPDSAMQRHRPTAEEDDALDGGASMDDASDAYGRAADGLPDAADPTAKQKAEDAQAAPSAQTMRLAVMLRPAAGEAALPEDIWRTVVNSEEGLRLPGKWDESVTGALAAARQADWALCAYLAARVFVKSGKNAGALAAKDEAAQRTLWLEVAAPVAVEVPPGTERLTVKLEGCQEADEAPAEQLAVLDRSSGDVFWCGRGKAKLLYGLGASARHFNAGATLELSQMLWWQSKLKQQVLLDDERLRLRDSLDSDKDPPKESDRRPGSNAPRLRCVPGLRYHVLAYPLRRDFSKAILRPCRNCWSRTQVSIAQGAVRRLGETLVSECAKAGKWGLVAALLEAGVPCPDLSREFEDVCGSTPAVRKQWLHDLHSAAAGHCKSLVELAAEAQDGKQALRQVLEALKAAKHGPIDLGRSLPGRPALIEVAAAGGRWDIVDFLLTDAPRYGAFVSTEPLMCMQELAHAPVDIIRKLQQYLKRLSPKQYFKRMHALLSAGEVMDREDTPMDFERHGELLVRDTMIVLDCPLRLGCRAGDPNAELVFFAVSETELDDAETVLREKTYSMLPLNLERSSSFEPRVVSVADFPSLGSSQKAVAETNAWIAVLCNPGFLRVQRDKLSQASKLLLELPVNQPPTPYIERSASVRIVAKSACCGEPLEGVHVYIANAKLGETEADGSLEVELPPGKHIISAPKHSRQTAIVEVKPGATHVEEVVELLAGDALFLYLEAVEEEDGTHTKDMVFMATNKTHGSVAGETGADELRPFVGTATVPRSAWLSLPFSEHGRGPAAALQVCPDLRCSKVLQDIKVVPADGREFRGSSSVKDTFPTDFDGCHLADLFQVRGCFNLGDLLDPPPPAVPEKEKAVSSARAELEAVQIERFVPPARRGAQPAPGPGKPRGGGAALPPRGAWARTPSPAALRNPMQLQQLEASAAAAKAGGRNSALRTSSVGALQRRRSRADRVSGAGAGGYYAAAGRTLGFCPACNSWPSPRSGCCYCRSSRTRPRDVSCWR